jgi:lipoprotein-releasing system permease protein
MAPGFEWFVAWRHLRDPERRSRRLLVAGLVVLVLGLLILGVAWWIGQSTPATTVSFFRARPPLIVDYLRQGAIGAIIAGAVITFLGALFATFTVFTAISIFGVFLGTSAPIIALSVMSGFESDLKGKIRGAKADVVITRAEEQPFTDWEEIRRKIAGVPGVSASTPYIESEVMLRSRTTPAGVILRGIDPASAPDVLDLERTLREGRVDDLAHPERVARSRGLSVPPPVLADDPADDLPREETAPDGLGGEDGGEQEDAGEDILPTILLGEELYQSTLRVFLGSEIAVACPLCGLGPSGPHPKLKPFRVAGHFYSGMYEFDSKLAYISLKEAQKFLSMHGEVTGVDVRVAAPEQAGRVARAIAAALGPGYEVRSWEELNRGLFMALRLEKIAMFIVLTFIALVASFSIVSNLIMLVTEKAREVAILKAMGASDGAILRVFFAEGLYIGLLGLVAGVTTGVIGCQLIRNYGLPLPTDVYYISQLPVVMRAGEILTVAALALLLCCLATIYPAVLASRMRPVDGLRYE